MSDPSSKAFLATRAKRLLRQWLPTAWSEFVSPLWSREQLLALINALVTSYLILQTASIARLIEEVDAWVLAITAFSWSAAIWAVLALLRAPFVALRRDQQLGTFVGNRFVYHRPNLVGTFRCNATGDAELFKVKFDHAEPGSFVYYVIEMDHKIPQHLYSAVLASNLVLSSDLAPGAGARQGGTRLGKDRIAHLIVTMKPETVSQTIRVYCRDFSVGSPNDKDGAQGERKVTLPHPDLSGDNTSMRAKYDPSVSHPTRA